MQMDCRIYQRLCGTAGSLCVGAHTEVRGEQEAGYNCMVKVAFYARCMSQLPEIIDHPLALQLGTMAEINDQRAAAGRRRAS